MYLTFIGSLYCVGMRSAGVQRNELTGLTKGYESANNSCGNTRFSIPLYGGDIATSKTFTSQVPQSSP